MGDPQRSGDDEKKPEPGDEADLSTRLQRLDSRLGEISSGREESAKAAKRKASDASGLGQAFRLSAEFIAGVIAGGFLGWMLDSFAGSSPWGFIIGLILGFGSGMLNMLRASGELNRRPTADKAPMPGPSSGQGRGDEKTD